MSFLRYVILFHCLANIGVAAGDNVNRLGYDSLGCWYLPKNVTAVADSLEGSHNGLEGLYWDRVNPVPKCAAVAKNSGFSYFAVRNGGECLAGLNLQAKYKDHGQSEECYDGEGGHDAIDVYNITGTIQDLDDFEGDILLTKMQKALTQPFNQDVADAGVWAEAQFLWPEGIVPYYIPPELVGHSLYDKFHHGMRHWFEQTCIKFVPKTGHRDWVELYREKNPLSRRCASSIGRIGGYQPIKLGDHCPAGSVIHEMGHTLGLWHTQSRPDRDDYIQILWENILPGKSAQFKKYSHGTIDTLKIKYDYMSIMHYGRDYFAKLDTEKRHYLTTIKTKDPKYQNLIGQRKYLTPSDILMVNTMYGCPDYPHIWKTGNWSDCSTACGPGKQTRDVHCAKKGAEQVHPKFCRNTKLPVNSRKCYGMQCEKCPSGWVTFSNACYKINAQRKTFQDAIDSCLSQGAGILTLRSAKEETYLRAELEKTNLYNYFYWLGARYSPSKGGFYWPDETAVAYNAWNPGEPRFGLDCSLMINRKGWGTERCDMERSYICKKELRNYRRSEIKKEADRTDFKWQTGDWNECPVSCGGGQQNRRTYCIDRNNTKVSNSLCKDPPPLAWKDCNMKPCPSQYKWHTRDWGKCSKTCGGGLKRRTKLCAGKDMVSTSWKLCKGHPPITKMECNTEPCPASKTRVLSASVWKVTSWGKCSKTCGPGYQVRVVYCSNNNNKPLKASLCKGLTKPIDLRRCSMKADCPLKRVHRCSDKHVMCRVWIKQGSCKTSKWVRSTCRRGCKVC